MAVTENKMIKDFVDAIKTGTKEKTKAYESPATVTRIENGVAWVHVPGGVEETPVQLTIAASEGDQVRVRVANGRATIVGNVTSPPTDDRTAMEALYNANVANLAARSASAAASSAEASAATAREYAEVAKETTDEINAYADTVGKTVTQVLEDGETAGAAAEQAKTSADTAWANLEQVQSILEVAQWIATHGTYVKANVFNPNATYYTLTATQVDSPSDDDKDSDGVLIYYELANGIYVRTTDTSVQSGKTYYNVTGTPVAQPSAEHIADYYTLAVTDAMADYIQAHLALTSEGLYVMKDGSEWKVKIADDGVYILDPNNRAANQMTGDGSIIGYENETYVKIDYHSLKLIDRENSTYFYVSDLRDKNGEAVIKKVYRGDGTSKRFLLPVEAKDTNYLVLVDSVELPVTKYTSYFDLDAPAPDQARVYVEYVSDTPLAKAYTLGYRAPYNSIGLFSVATGYEVTADGIFSFCSGNRTEASGDYSHAEGQYARAEGEMSHAEGYRSVASGDYSHVEGVLATASGRRSHAEGYYTIAEGDSSHAEGLHAEAHGAFSHAEGEYTLAEGHSSHAGGRNTTAGYNYQTVIGQYNDNKSTHALEIGNGNFGEPINYSNALAVCWDGNVEMALDTTAQSGVDKEIYDALVNLGWDSDVII